MAQDPAAPAPAADSGDTAFVLISAALVLLMTIPGLTLFYGAMMRTKNILGALAQSLVMGALISESAYAFGSGAYDETAGGHASSPRFCEESQRVKRIA